MKIEPGCLVSIDVSMYDTQGQVLMLDAIFGAMPHLWLWVAASAVVLTVFFYSLMRVAARADRDSERIQRRMDSHHFDSSVIALEAHRGRFARVGKGLDGREVPGPRDAA